jgi:hypothetical protein
METAANQATSEELPACACTAAQLDSLFNVAESAIRLHAAEGMLPRLPRDRLDCVWLLNLASGQRITADTNASLSLTATVMVGWLYSIGELLDSKFMAFFAIVFERNGFSRNDFDAAVDEALAFFDAEAVRH